MTCNLDFRLAELAKEISQLMQSGENWQIVLHGGQGGDVIMEVKRTRRLVPPHKQQGPPITQK